MAGKLCPSVATDPGAGLRGVKDHQRRATALRARGRAEVSDGVPSRGFTRDGRSERSRAEGRASGPEASPASAGTAPQTGDTSAGKAANRIGPFSDPKTTLL